jgi:hypothetical protein
MASLTSKGWVRIIIMVEGILGARDGAEPPSSAAMIRAPTARGTIAMQKITMNATSVPRNFRFSDWAKDQRQTRRYFSSIVRIVHYHAQGL